MAREMTSWIKGGLNRTTVRWICLSILAMSGALGAWAQGNAMGNGNDTRTEEVLLPGAVFEVATIKPSDLSMRGSSAGSRPNGAFSSKNRQLKNVICDAYEVLPMQCFGGPAWLESDRYDIDAKPDSATAEQLMKLSWKERGPVQRRMEQALLADRLKLKTHFETKEMTVFALVVAKGGLKIHEAKPDDTYANGLKRTDGKPFGTRVFMMGNGSMTAQGMSLDNLVLNLPGITGHLVENKTGLTGVYDFTLHYSPTDPPPPDSPAPSIYTALEEQLGLKLEPIKAPVKSLVIDHVERPSEN